MARLLFTDDLLTGFDEIDDQHRRMFAAAQRVLDLREPHPVALSRTVQFLLNYAWYHFRAEEAAMISAAYPRAPHHLAQHDRIRQEIGGIREALEAGAPAPRVMARIQVLFEDWYTQHIREVDVPLARFLRSRAEARGSPDGGGRVPEAAPVLPCADDLVRAGSLEPECAGIDLPRAQPGEKDDWIVH